MFPMIPRVTIVDALLMTGLCVAFAVAGARRITSARRLHRVGRTSDAVYRAQMVMGISTVMFLPVTVAIISWLGFFAAVPLVVLAFGVVVWADESEKSR